MLVLPYKQGISIKIYNSYIYKCATVSAVTETDPESEWLWIISEQNISSYFMKL